MRVNDEGATVLASGLKYCRNLERIIISNNQLTKKGVHEIFKSLQQCNLKIESENIIIKKSWNELIKFCFRYLRTVLPYTHSHWRHLAFACLTAFIRVANNGKN